MLILILSGIASADVINLTDDVTTFRTQCMKDNEVICDSQILNSHGENGTLKNIWSNLTITEKRNIGINLYNYLSSSVFYTHTITTTCNDINCSSPQVGMCVQNALIKVLRFSISDESFSGCYYKNMHNEVKSYYYPDSYGLPAYPTQVVSADNNFYHSIGGLQIGDNVSDFNNWLFFQYNDADILPGEWNMPLPAVVTIKHLCPGSCTGYGCGDLITFSIDKNFTPRPTPIPTPTPLPTPTPSPTPPITPTPTPTSTPTPVPPIHESSGSSSSSGLSTSGEVSTPTEPFLNLVKSYKQENYIYRGITSEFNFTKAQMLINKININSEVYIPEVILKIEELKNVSELTGSTQVDNVLKYYNIWINTMKFKNASIRFNCDNDNGILLLKWNNNTWEQLNIIKVSDNICETKTNTLSTTFVFTYNNIEYVNKSKIVIDKVPDITQFSNVTQLRANNSIINQSQSNINSNQNDNKSIFKKIIERIGYFVSFQSYLH